MVKRFASFWLISLVLAAPLQLPVLAQAPLSKQEQKAATIKSKLEKMGSGSSSVVKIKLIGGDKIEGSLSEIGSTDFRVAERSGASKTIRYDEVDSIGGKNLSTGAKIAIGVGIGAGATLLILYLTFLHITRNN
ncbi:MAG: hypothetical protein QM785_13700 [Pyrinomonadaceae bacterium]